MTDQTQPKHVLIPLDTLRELERAFHAHKHALFMHEQTSIPNVGPVMPPHLMSQYNFWADKMSDTEVGLASAVDTFFASIGRPHHEDSIVMAAQCGDM